MMLSLLSIFLRNWTLLLEFVLDVWVHGFGVGVPFLMLFRVQTISGILNGHYVDPKQSSHII